MGSFSFGSEPLASNRIRVEWFNSHDLVTTFTAAARIYER